MGRLNRRHQRNLRIICFGRSADTKKSEDIEQEATEETEDEKVNSLRFLCCLLFQSAFLELLNSSTNAKGPLRVTLVKQV
jgi:hypothetical protein